MDERTPQEISLIKSFEQRRKRKNERSRERTRENRAEMNRILKIPEDQRSRDEQQWLNTYMRAKRRKNLKDRERRKRIKMMKMNALSEKDEGEEEEGGEGKLSSSLEEEDVSQWQILPHDISQSHTYTSQESNGDYIANIDSIESTSFETNHAFEYTKASSTNDENITSTKPSTMQVCSEDNFD